MWTIENRHRYDRDKLRYPSDLTDAEWELVEPLIPPAKRGGGKRTVQMREVLNGVMYVLSTGCQWTSCQKSREKCGGAVTPPPVGILLYRNHIRREGSLPRSVGARPDQASRRARRRQDRFAPLRGGLRPVLTAAARGAVFIRRPGRRNAAPAELRN